MIRITCYFLLLLTGLSQCAPPPAPAGSLPTFFDLVGYFEAEIDRLAALGPVSKTTIVNGAEATQDGITLDFRTDLAPFISADINRPAWLDKYTIDSLTTPDGSLRQLTYTAVEEDLFTRLLVVHFDGPRVDSIYIEKGSELMIADTKRRLTYVPARGYSLDGAQRVVLASDNSIYVEVRF